MRSNAGSVNPAGPLRLVLFGLVAVLVLVVGLSLTVLNDRAVPPVAVASASAPSATSPSPLALRDLAPKRMKIGSAVSARALAADPSYAKVLAATFNSVTPENSLKWALVEPSEGNYRWADSDQLMSFAKKHGQAVYGHTLVWHSEVPSWILESSSPEVLRNQLRRHITTTVSRYRDKIWAWDVVNEVLNEDGTLRDTIWLRKLGPGYIADAFRWAHAADAAAKLYINEYGAEGSGRKSDALLALVKLLRSEGVPVHGVGFQSHFAVDRVPEDFAARMRSFADTGVQVAVTELDVRIELPTTPEELARQAWSYQQVLQACLDNQACVSLTTWGFSDAYSWIPGYHLGYGAACLFDEALRPKPALQQLMRMLSPATPPAGSSRPVPSGR